MPDLVDAAPACALAVYAHPDDADVSCGGTLARWAVAGADVHLVVCARGDKGSADPASDPDQLALRRAAEMEDAAGVLGTVAPVSLGFDDGEVENTPELRARLVEVVRAVRPEVVVCPDPTAVFFGDRYFNHRDHRTVGWATLDAVSPAAANPHYFPDAGDVHQVRCVYLSGTLEPNCWVDVTRTLDVKVDAVSRHASQLGEAGEWFRSVLRQRAEEAGAAAGVPYAEAFRRLQLT